MESFSYVGRADGIGNRIEEIIHLEVLCSKMKMECDYIWTNILESRTYEVCFVTENVSVRVNDQPAHPVKNFSDFDCSYNQTDILTAARKIRPKFNLSFKGAIHPIGVHIRGSDRIGSTHHHYMKNEEELLVYLSGAVDIINQRKPNHLFVCSEDNHYKNLFLKYIDHDLLVAPIYDPSIPSEYVDFFSLTLCDEVIMASRFSSFAVTASLIGNIPLISFVSDVVVEQRYQALFHYHLDFDKDLVKENILGRNIYKIRNIIDRNY